MISDQAEEACRPGRLSQRHPKDLRGLRPPTPRANTIQGLFTLYELNPHYFCSASEKNTFAETIGRFEVRLLRLGHSGGL